MSTTITRDELWAAIDAGEATVIETLGPMYFADQHLPGAINLPHTDVVQVAGDLLPDRDALVVTYCSNAACQNSDIAANQLVAMGYTNVRRDVEGKQDWTDAGLPVESQARSAV